MVLMQCLDVVCNKICFAQFSCAENKAFEQFTVLGEEETFSPAGVEAVCHMWLRGRCRGWCLLVGWSSGRRISLCYGFSISLDQDRVMVLVHPMLSSDQSEETQPTRFGHSSPYSLLLTPYYGAYLHFGQAYGIFGSLPIYA